jgi:hypothetical protein
MYALFKYDLKKRQCMFSTLAMEMVWTKKDQLHIEIPIKVPEYQLHEGGGVSNFVAQIQARNFTSKGKANN